MGGAAKAKRLMYLAHRWTGIAGCLLMLVWFVSGMIMLYVGYPKLTPWERLAALPELDPRSCCAALDEAAGDPPGLGASGKLVLTSIAGAPAYVAEEGGRPRVYDGATGAPRETEVGAQEALRAARDFARGGAPDAAEDEAPPPDSRPAGGAFRGLIHEDRWTHSGGLNAHRPLYEIEVSAPEPATLYVSSRTGQVVLDAPLAQQRWNYVGAWLHWLYAFRNTPVDPVWSWTVIALSLMGTLSALSGVCVGIWRWRFTSRYKSGSRSPYREPWMKWHHVAGLLFSGFVCAWIFSGLMSMNPAGIFSPAQEPDLAAYAGDRHAPAGALADPRRIVAALRAQGFRPVELAWRRVAGRPYVLAFDRRADTRIVKGQGDGLAVAPSWSPEEIAPAAQKLFPAPVLRQTLVTAHDAYYYQRHPEAMNGAQVRGLPALRLDFADPERTRVYMDLTTGQVGLSLSRSQRAGRWLFYFLHSWDTPALLDTQALRDAVLIVLSLGGIIVSAAGTVLGWRRLRRRRRAPA